MNITTKLVVGLYLLAWTSSEAKVNDSLYFDLSYKRCSAEKATYKSHKSLIDSVNGISVFFYLTGEKNCSFTSVSDKIEGTKTTWFKNGIQKSTENYSNGQLQDTTRIYDSTGRLRHIENFNKGILTKGITLKENQLDTARVYYILEQPPSFPGGENALLIFLQSNVRYPEKAISQEIEGKILVYFEVDTTGKVMNVKIHKGGDKVLDKAAIKVIQSSPDWIPGIRRGEKDIFRQIIPIIYKLH